MTEPVWWAGFIVVLVGSIGWSPICWEFRSAAVPGSHRRYVANTVEKLLRYPAALYCVWLYASKERGSLILLSAISAVCVFGYLLRWRAHRKLDRDDDDDWFNRTGRRIARWFRVKVTKTMPA